MALPSERAVDEALSFVGQLTYCADSHYRAELLGGLQFVGWGHDQIIAADTRDAIYVLTAGLSGEKVTPEDLYPRPTGSQSDPEADAPTTIADFDVAAFMRRLAGA